MSVTWRRSERATARVARAVRGARRLAALVALLVLSSCGAERNDAELTLERALAADWSDLEVQIVTRMPEDQVGGSAVVMLHGYGSRGSDQAGLARRILDDDMRVFLPTAALPHPSGRGAIWWEFIGEDWPRPYSEDLKANAWPKPSRQLVRARDAIVRLIEGIRRRYQPAPLAIVGHSQGAMLALDVAMALDPPPDRVAAVSGYVLLDSIAAIESAREPRPRVLISHGRSDSIVGFESAETMLKVLERNGFVVRFEPHDGGHAIDAAVVQDLRDFLSP